MTDDQENKIEDLKKRLEKLQEEINGNPRSLGGAYNPDGINASRGTESKDTSNSKKKSQ